MAVDYIQEKYYSTNEQFSRWINSVPSHKKTDQDKLSESIDMLKMRIASIEANMDQMSIV